MKILNFFLYNLLESLANTSSIQRVKSSTPDPHDPHNLNNNNVLLQPFSKFLDTGANWA
jgi:hypothetical protein